MSPDQLAAIERRVLETPEHLPLPDFGRAPVLALIAEVRRLTNELTELSASGLRLKARVEKSEEQNQKIGHAVDRLANVLQRVIRAPLGKPDEAIEAEILAAVAEARGACK